MAYVETAYQGSTVANRRRTPSSRGAVNICKGDASCWCFCVCWRTGCCRGCCLESSGKTSVVMVGRQAGEKLGFGWAAEECTEEEYIMMGQTGGIDGGYVERPQSVSLTGTHEGATKSQRSRGRYVSLCTGAARLGQQQ